jgi:hypothetical protein
LCTLLAGAFLGWRCARHFGDVCQCVSLSVRARHRCPSMARGDIPDQRVFLEVLSASRRLFSRCG